MPNDQPDGPLLRLRQVGKTYHMGEVAVEVLRNISLDLRRGEFVVMVGPSGSGKSTILNIMGGMDRPTTGEVWYGDRDLTHAESQELTLYRRHAVGFIFQFYNLVPNLTAVENVMVSTQLTPNSLEPLEMLDLVGLSERVHHFPSQLSGGEQQRVAIARALAKNPELLLCDEPTGALDYETGKRVLRLLVDVNDRWQRTVMLITHNVAIAPIADRVLHLRSGEIVEDTRNERRQPPEEVVW
jgi:putative ABC transport system ATP-binding protein